MHLFIPDPCSYHYDRAGELSETIYPDGTVVRKATTYADGGTLGLLRCQVVEDRHLDSDPGPFTGARTVYNSVGRAIRSERINTLSITVTRNGEVCDTAYVYDPVSTVGILSRTRTEYLADGRVYRTIADNDLSTSSDDAVTVYEYGADGLSKITRPPSVVDAIAGTTITTEVIETFHLNGNLRDTQTRSYGTFELEAHKPVTRFDYDDLNRRWQTRSCVNEMDADGVVGERSQYDWSGRAWLQVDADNHAKAFVYNDAGQLAWVVTDVNPGLTSLPPGAPTTWTGGSRLADSTVTQYKYDELGQQIAQIDGKGNTTRFDYDLLERRKARYLPSHTTASQGEEWFYDYDEASGQSMTGATNPKRPNKVKHVDFLDQQMIMVHDLAGRLDQKKSDATTVLVDYDYTPSGQRARMQDNFVTTLRETRYAYDNRNRLRVKSTPEGTLTYGYDDNTGNLTSINAQYTYTGTAWGGTIPATGYRYDSTWETAGKRTLSHSSGASMTYAFDARNRLTKVNADGVNLADPADAKYAYNSVGSQAKMKYRNTVETSYAYNSRNQLRLMRSYLVATPATTMASFDYDDADPNDGGLVWPSDRKLAVSGLRRGMRENIQGAVRQVAYSFDNLRRLTKETLYTGAWATESGAAQYDATPGYADTGGFDAVGNRRARTVTGTFPGLATATTSYSTYTANDLLGPILNTKVGATFDANGNTTKIDLNADGAADDATPDVYDRENRLITATRGASTIGIVYDGDGNRVKKTVGSTATKYLVDGRNPTGYAQVLEERNGSDATVVAYVYGLDLISQKRGSTTHYYGYDGLGTVRYLTDSTGAINDTYTHDGFGILVERKARRTSDGVLVAFADPAIETAPAGTVPAINLYRYTGEQYDTDLKVYYLRARYYKPELGRFWTMDTYEGNNEDALSLHKYLYAHANPVNNIDPSGNSLIETMAALFVRYKLHAAIITVGTFVTVHAYHHIKGREMLAPEKQKVRDAIAVLREPKLNGKYAEYAELLQATHIKIDPNLVDNAGVPSFSARIIFLNPETPFFEKEILAAILVHEAVHVKQWFIAFKREATNERPAYEKDNEFLNDYGIKGYVEDMAKIYPIAGGAGWFDDAAMAYGEYQIANPAVTAR